MPTEGLLKGSFEGPDCEQVLVSNPGLVSAPHEASGARLSLVEASRKVGKTNKYPVVIINWVQYLGPPGPFSFPDSRDLLEVLGGLSWQRESPREDPLGSGRIP